MKTSKILLVSCFVVVAFLAFVYSAKAATLSQSNVYLSAGQSSTVYATNVSTSIYLSNNTNNSIATVTISGNSINIYGVMAGSTTATICEYSINTCNSIYITVSGSTYGGSLSLSQTNLPLTVGQTSVVTAYNSYSYGTLYISSNSNQGVATAYVNGNSISIYGVGVGSSTIIVCQNGSSSSCGTIYVSVTSGYGGYLPPVNNSGITLSSLILPVGGAATVTSANSANLTVSSNSNPGVAITSYTSTTPGCTAGAAYSVITGQPCFGGGYSGYNGGYSSVPGCTATSLYSYLTGQPCNNGQINSYGSNSNSMQILAASAGSDTIIFCQNNNYSCSTIYVTVY